jgi:serine/threonine protein kinase
MSSSLVPQPPDPPDDPQKRAEDEQPLPEALGNNAAPLSPHQATLTDTSEGIGTHPAAEGEQSHVGYKFGDFELLEELGRGGMGIVYKARQVSLDRPVAVKMLLADHFQNATVMQRFLAEARAVAALDHPDIVKIYQIGECPLGHYFAMEYLDGQPLSLIIEKGPLPVATCASLVMALAKTMDYAHGKGIIHRDLKPANIMVSPIRRPVIMDFGIAKVTTGKSSFATEQGVVIGTPSYMAPEQASDDAGPVAPHSDVYSLGAILYATLTGKAPFQEKTALSTILKVISEPPPSVRSLRPEAPAALEEICLKCLQKRPADRYATARDLADALRGFRTQTGAAAKSDATRIWVTPPSIILVVQATGKQIRLSDTVTLIGRSSECDLVLKSASVSKRHCQIVAEDNEIWVEDLESANGTLVNGQMIERCRLKTGDVLEIAGHAFKVRVPQAK